MLDNGKFSLQTKGPGGSSLHLSRVTNEEELYTALNSLFSMGEEAIVETAVVGREVTCGVLGEEALAPILVVSKGNYFDYHNKYAPDGAQEICPAPIAPEETAKVQDAALRAHHALGLKGYSRADFILQDDGTLVVYGKRERSVPLSGCLRRWPGKDPSRADPDLQMPAVR